MKCDFCEKKATVFLTQLIEGQMKKVCLCDPCATERGVTDPTGFSLADQILGGQLIGSNSVSTNTAQVAAGNGKQCPTCTFTLEDLRRVRRLGCSDCYATFSEEIGMMIRGMHKGTSHLGKVPEGLMALQFRNQRIDELQSRLDLAIASESYEEAAGIRDEIRMLDEARS